MRPCFVETDILIAEVWGSAQRRSDRLSSEKRLMIAVLNDAFDCYQKYILADDRIGRQLFAEAAAWLNSTSSDGLFSFLSITETLDIEPEYVRRGLAEWHRRHVAMQTGTQHSVATAETNGASLPIRSSADSPTSGGPP